MHCLWAWGRPATARDVLTDVNKQWPLAYSTVKSVAGVLRTGRRLLGSCPPGTLV